MKVVVPLDGLDEGIYTGQESDATPGFQAAEERAFCDTKNSI